MEIFFENLVKTYFVIVIRYLLLATLVFLVFYKIFKSRFAYIKIQLKFPENKDYYREILYSLLSVFIMAATSAPFFMEPLNKYSQVFYDLNQMPWWYHTLSFLGMVLLHDMYFYWMHRTLHHPEIFKTAHLIHHKSVNPSPFAAYSFHPIEAFFESLIGPIILLIMPINMFIFIAFFIFQIAYNVYGHSGFEIFSERFHRHWFGKWINTSVHHNLHHKYFNNSYGLYFTIWDRLMGTMHPKYDKTYKELKKRKNI